MPSSFLRASPSFGTGYATVFTTHATSRVVCTARWLAAPRCAQGKEAHRATTKLDDKRILARPAAARPDWTNQRALLRRVPSFRPFGLSSPLLWEKRKRMWRAIMLAGEGMGRGFASLGLRPQSAALDPNPVSSCGARQSLGRERGRVGVPNTVRPNGADQRRNRPRPNDAALGAVCLDAHSDVSRDGCGRGVEPAT